jgi:hypothetical protein
MDQKIIFIDRTNPFNMKTPQSEIIKLKRKTSRSPAQLTITVPDELVEKLMGDEVELMNGIPDKLFITGLALKYGERE